MPSIYSDNHALMRALPDDLAGFDIIERCIVGRRISRWRDALGRGHYESDSPRSPEDVEVAFRVQEDDEITLLGAHPHLGTVSSPQVSAVRTFVIRTTLGEWKQLDTTGAP